ncbi:MAG TPA: NAD(P)-binding protein [Thermoanaerobaculia bacterium]|nr:NAD(P)-binding protein [Thermoanaerobaculia bacterium]
MTEENTGRKKVAVLGGGCGALSAVWALTELPGWEEKYDITVYQVGWRLGGKCASGRNLSAGGRIEEHGLHVWAGFYENGFRMMQRAYAALPPDPANPIRGWEDAFRKHSAVMIYEQVGGRWVDWPMTFPENDAVPGAGGEFPSLWDYVQLILDWIIQQIESGSTEAIVPHAPIPGAPTLWQRIERFVERVVERASLREILEEDHEPGTPPPLASHSAHDILVTARKFAGTLDPDPAQHLARDHHDLLYLVSEAEQRLAERRAAAPDDDGLRRIALLLDLAHATIRGMIMDGVIFFGFHVIDGVDWRDWLARHGAATETIDSALVRGIYDYVFGFFHGRASEPRLEAGTAMHGVLRLFFTYKGALFWEMQAGMGDIVFAPLYRVLKARGVRFEFFRKITNLALSLDGKSIGRIDLLEQAHPRQGEYDPLTRVKGVPAWPSEPFYDQLAEGNALRDEKINLESAWTPWTGKPGSLEAGKDFDAVILGLSLAAVRDVAPEILAAGGPLAKMLTEVQTVQTGALQLWFSGNAEGIGAPPTARICSSYAQDLNTWADMSFLLPREDWPAGPAPGFIAYLCGEFPDADVIPPFSDPTFPARELDRFTQAATAWLEQNAGHIWTRTAPTAGSFDWSLLFDPASGNGPARLLSQYRRVNIDPTERYVLSLPGTSRYRLRAGDSGYANLFLAGDWVKTSINAGCVEAAVMAGMDAASALSGVRIPVIGGLP